MPALLPPLATAPRRCLAAVAGLLTVLLLPLGSGHAADPVLPGNAPPPSVSADPQASEPEGVTFHLSTCQGAHVPITLPARPDRAPAAAPPPPEPHSTIDVGIFYTTALRQEQGGTQAIQAKINQLIADSTQIFQRSGVHVTLRLATAQEVHYTENSDYTTDLHNFMVPDDGYMDQVHTIRNQVKADLMVLLRTGNGGEAYANTLLNIPDNIAYADTLAFAVAPIYKHIFTHELGHAMGLAHDRYEQGCLQGNCNKYTAAYPYGYGYVNLRGLAPGAPQSRRWYTVMAYASLCFDLGIGCKSNDHFSNPQKTYHGDPMGISSTSTALGKDGPADAARALNNVRTIVANFRGGNTKPPKKITGYLENPAQNSPQSGVGLVSGWACDSAEVIVEFELASGQTYRLPAAVGTLRSDTQSVCGHDDTGFGLLWNWNILGDGTHTVRAYVDGTLLGEHQTTVTTLGLGDFPRGLSGTFPLSNFPRPGTTTSLEWSQTRQNFVIAGSRTTPSDSGGTRRGAGGVLENPGPGTAHSGVEVISGWHCEAEAIRIELTNGTTGAVITTQAGAGTERADTLGVCGDTDNGFGLLWNWNILRDGWHTVRAFADEEPEPFAWSQVFVTTLGEEFARGLSGEYELEPFPAPGQAVTVEWRQEQQNFVITGVE